MTEVDNKPASGGSMAKGVMVLIVFLLCAGGGGFAVGFTQKFAPVQKVAPSAADSTSATATSTDSSTSSTTLKKVYWLATSGWERAGYAIKVYINDQSIGTFQTPDRIEEVTKYLKPGTNKIRFDAKALPAGNRNDYNGAHLVINLMQGEKYSSHGYKNGSKLLQYERKVTETENFDDTQDVEIVE